MCLTCTAEAFRAGVRLVVEDLNAEGHRGVDETAELMTKDDVLEMVIDGSLDLSWDDVVDIGWQIFARKSRCDHSTTRSVCGVIWYPWSFRTVY